MLDFPKSARLLSRKDFTSIRNSNRKIGRYLCLDVRVSNAVRLGITTSAKFGDSHERNRFRRIVRESFRRLKNDLPTIDLHIIPRQFAKNAKMQDIEQEIRDLLLPKKI
jgi:ribonuclease P protein component